MISFRFLSHSASGLVGLALITSVALAVAVPQYSFTTLAGSAGVKGSADGLGGAARFNDPASLAVDGAGNMYVADTGNHTIRKISPTGVVTTLAGLAGVSGNANGTGASARFNYPDSIAVDSAGTVYVGESQPGTVRKITAAGVVSPLSVVGPYDGPYDLVVNASDKLYAATGFGGIVQVMPTGEWVPLEITPEFAVYTLALDTAGHFYAAVEDDVYGSYGVLQFSPPSEGEYLWAGPRNAAHAIDRAGTIFTTFAHEVGVVTPGTEKPSRLAGADVSGSADGVATDARFNRPSDIAVDRSGTLYILDRGNHTLRKGTLLATPSYISEYTFTTLAGSPGNSGSADGSGSNARFDEPSGIAVDAEGNVFVADTNNHTIRKITPDGTVSTIAGLAGVPGTVDGSGGAARFDHPSKVTVDSSDRVVVIELLHVVVNGLAQIPVTLRSISPTGQVSTRLEYADDAVFGGTGDLHLVAWDNLSAAIGVEKVAPNGKATTVAYWDDEGYFPTSLAVDASGNIYVAETAYYTHSRGRVQKVTPDGFLSNFSSGFADPTNMTIDNSGNLYVADRSLHAIVKVNSTGVWREPILAVDSTGRDVRFDSPLGVAVDAAGNIYVADAGNHTIRKGTPVRSKSFSRLVNASVRANLMADRRLIVGIVTSGGAKPMLVRAIGPGLMPYMDAGAVLAANPRLELYNAKSSIIDSNDDWGGGAALRETFSALGAFALTAGGTDAALLRSVDGPQTAHALTTMTGIGLVELYDTDPTNTIGPRLVNFSTRYEVGAGARALILGFVITGPGEEKVLIRGVGPALTQLGVAGVLADPRLEIFNSTGQRFAENDNWSSDLAIVAARVGAFALPTGSKDAAVLLTLPPGIYTALLTGADGGTGEGLLEVYEVQ